MVRRGDGAGAFDLRVKAGRESEALNIRRGDGWEDEVTRRCDRARSRERLIVDVSEQVDLYFYSVKGETWAREVGAMYGRAGGDGVCVSSWEEVEEGVWLWEVRWVSGEVEAEGFGHVDGGIAGGECDEGAPICDDDVAGAYEAGCERDGDEVAGVDEGLRGALVESLRGTQERRGARALGDGCEVDVGGRREGQQFEALEGSVDAGAGGMGEEGAELWVWFLHGGRGAERGRESVSRLFDDVSDKGRRGEGVDEGRWAHGEAVRVFEGLEVEKGSRLA